MTRTPLSVLSEVDCVLGTWQDDGSCTQECGGGMIHQIKPLLVAPAFNGASCHPEMERWVPCNEQPCAIDCEWTLWSGWSPCSAACGDGTPHAPHPATTV